MSIYDMITSFFIITISWLCAALLAKKIKVPIVLNSALFFWHTAFCIFYWLYSQSNVADATLYYETALLGDYRWIPGTGFVEALTAVFASFLGFSELNTFLIYNLIGFFGLALLASVLINLWPYKTGCQAYIPRAIIFLPGLSFWSVAIGKDAISFLAICLAVYSFLNINANKKYFFIAVVLMFMVRPHVATLMVGSGLVALMMGANVNLVTRFFLIISGFFAVIVATPFVLEYVGMNDGLSISETTEYIQTRQSYNQDGGGGVDISSMSLIEKMFTYLFRPMFIDAAGFLGVAVSFENLALVILFATYFFPYFVRFILSSNPAIRFNVIYFISTLIVLSLTTANLGIAIRQKMMFLPSILFLVAIGANYGYIKRIKKLHLNIPMQSDVY